MMNDLLTERQWEQLSAYLDGALSQKDKNSLDLQLTTNQELSEALETLRQNRRLLQNLPKRRVPRNFTLTAEMVAPKSRRPFILFPAFSAVSAIATLLFFITLLFGRFTSYQMATALESPAQKEALAAPASETAVKPTPWIIYWGGGDGRGGGGGNAGEAKAMPMTVPEFAPPLAPEATPQPPAAKQQNEQAPLVGAGPILGIQPTTSALALSPLPIADNASETSNIAKNSQVGLLATLAVIALASAAAAYIFWRRTRQ